MPLPRFVGRSVLFAASALFAVCLTLPLPLPAAQPQEQTAGIAASPFKLQLRSRTETAPDSGRFHTVLASRNWNPAETAVVVCDMWDLHHCLNATRRGAEMAPRMNRFLNTARRQGALIIHAPSSCMAAYEDHPARLRALAAPRSQHLPKEIGQWCYNIPSEEQGDYPIDQTDGGEDDDLAEHAEWASQLEALGRNPKAPWKKQTDALYIDAAADIISDNGEEIWSVMEQRGVKNVILVGVHVNMCVLGRPFGLRQMAKNGKQVVLVRDLTDTMYNPARKPYVSHFTGTDLIVEHIEKWVCPTITSDQLLGGRPFRFRNDRRPHLVIVSAEREYRTEETLPAFARQHLGRTFRVSYVFANANERNDLPGIEVLRDADLALISVRRRVLPPEQMQVIRDFVAAGKPIVGVRTANHAFSLRKQEPPAGYQDWTQWDHEIIGGNYSNHYGSGPAVRVSMAPGAEQHVILRGVDAAKLVSHGSLYVVHPLVAGATPLLMGAVEGHPAEPVAWTHHTPTGGRVFYMSIAHADDFAQEGINRLLSNALHWAAGITPPNAVAKK